MDSTVLLPKKIDVSKLRYSEVKTLPTQSKTVYINYGSEKLTVQTPVMSIPYGIGDWNNKDSKKEDDKKAVKKYDLSVSFRGMDDNRKLKEFHDKLQDIEKKVVEDAFTNRLTWLNDDYDGIKSIVAKLFTPMVKYDKDKNTGKVVGKYPPTFKVKLPYDNQADSFNFEACDMEGDDLDFKSVMTKLKGAKCQLIIQLTGLWIAAGRYGCTWKVIKGKFELPNKSKYDYVVDSDDEDAVKPSKKNAVIEEDDDLVEDAEAMANAVSPPPKKSSAPVPVDDDDEEEEDDDVPPPAPKKSTVVIPDDDEDEEEEADEEDEEEEDVAPPPPPPKKTTAKKTTTKAK